MRIWRKIKKYYFKIYHFLKLIGIFLIFFLPVIVYADEYDNCFDEYKLGNVETVYSGFGYMERMRPSLIVEPNKRYYVRLFPKASYTCSNEGCFVAQNTNIWNQNSQSLGTVTLSYLNFDKNTNILTLDTPNNANLYYLGLNIRTSSGNTLKNQVVGTPLIYSDNIDDIKSCPQVAPEGSQIYDDFLTIYVDRFNYLGNGLLENPYLFVFAGIIFSFVVLEIFLHILHIRGGYKK